MIKVELAGICGSDIHAFYGKHPFISCPIVLGHEFLGVVSKTGDGSTELVGERVTVLPSIVCGVCHNCEIGRFNICQKLRVIGCQAPGAFAKYVVVPKDMAFALPESFSSEHGVLVEPLAVAVHAARRVSHIAGQTALVLGAGTIGLMVVATLKAYGAANIIVTDFNDNRLELAKKLGADHVVNPGKTNLNDWTEENVDRIDTTFECVGIADTVNQGIVLTHKGGNVVILGVFEEDVMVNMGLVQDKEINMVGTLMYTKEDYRESMRIMGFTPQLDQLITHRFRLADVSAGFEVLNDKPNETIKVVIKI